MTGVQTCALPISEGFYSVGRRQLHRIGRWPRSLNLGYPNSFDRAWGRTGSYILVHGGCSSVGCFAMTNAVMAEIFDLSERALRGGQPRVELHVFPFKMTDANLAAHAKNPWLDFWRNLKEGYDAFETTRLPPRVGLCDRRYVVEANRPGEVGAEGPLALCGALRAAQVEPNSQSFAQLPPDWPQPRPNPETTAPDPDSPLQRAAYSGQPLSPLPSLDEQSLLLPPRINLNRPRGVRFAAAPPLLVAPPCNLGLASCRKFLAMKSRTDGRQLAGGRGRISKAAGAQIAQAMGKLSAALKSDASQRRNVR